MAGRAGAKARREGFRIRKLPVETGDIGWRHITDSHERRLLVWTW